MRVYKSPACSLCPLLPSHPRVLPWEAGRLIPVARHAGATRRHRCGVFKTPLPLIFSFP